MNKLLVIAGPTAVGKTQLAFKLAEKFNGELVSADSRQVYKGMDIGTGKEWGNAPTWGYDVVEPNEEWSAAHFVKFAQKVIADVQQRGKLPIVVGGTGLYISNLLNPPETLDIPPDKQLRQQLEKLSLSELQNELIHFNEKRFNQMNYSDQRNSRRLIRAIEVVKFPKLHNTRLAERDLAPQDNDSLHIALTAPIKEIDRRIEDRVQQRIKMGAEQEVRILVKKYGWNSVLKFTIGYKEWKPLIDRERERDRDRETIKKDAIACWSIHEKQYARRQLTWMAKYSPDKMFDISEPNCYQDIEAYVSQWYYGE